MINYWGICASQSSKALPSDKWSHFTLVWRPSGNSALIQFYLNGQPIGVKHLHNINRSNQHDWPTSVWYFGMGESPISMGNNYEGLVSDLTIYQKALSPKDVKRVMRGDFLIKGSFGSR